VLEKILLNAWSYTWYRNNRFIYNWKT
jgi:hypothetical protein